MYTKIQYISQGETAAEQLSNITDVLTAGYKWIQLRFKNKPEQEFLQLARQVKELCKAHNAILIINDSVAVAKKVDADGLHVGKEDISVPAARVILGADKIIGGTANTLEDVVQHISNGCNYIGLGPFAFTTTKEKLSPVLGAVGYTKIMKALRQQVQMVPIYAIGGITAGQVKEIAASGVYGIALSGEITRSGNKRALKTELQNALSEGGAGLAPLTGQGGAELPADEFNIAGLSLTSRLMLGSGKFGSATIMRQAIKASGCQIATVALKRVDVGNKEDDMLNHLKGEGLHLMPNTSGARNAKEAVFAAQLAREALHTDLIKLEIHPDPKYLMPDPIETLKATEELAKLGFKVLPYIHADPVLCKLLESAGTAAVMPLGAPIGSNLGLSTKDFLKIIIEQSTVPVIVDAGIGAPSHAAQAMELGADAVLVNTAISVAKNPVQMAQAFKQAVEAGRLAYLAGLGAQSLTASPSSPLTSFLS